MCMVDDCDYWVTVLRSGHPCAQKIHQCDECRRAIEPGERYLAEATLFEGDFNYHRTCRHCEKVRRWLLAECNGFMYDGIAEDIQQHADEGVGGVGVKLMAHGIANGWRRRDGALGRVPGMPRVTP